MKHLACALGSMLLLAGCSTSQTAQTVAASETALTAAEATALQYAELPSCAAGATSGAGGTLCSQPTVVAQIKAADDVAYAAVKAAEGGTGTAAAASAAIAALTAAIPVQTSSK